MIRTASSCTAVSLQDTGIEELQMKIDNAYFYIDSKAVINYICNDYLFQLWCICHTQNSWNKK